MSPSTSPEFAARGLPTRSDSGFSFVELLVAMLLGIILFTGVTAALISLASSQRSTWNRTELHAGVRGAVELLQQEVGQAGRVTLPAAVTLTSATNTTASVVPIAVTVGVSSTAGMFVGEQLIIDAGNKRETVPVTAVNTGANQITATFEPNETHAVGAPVTVLGGFASGIVPSTTANGSTDSVLKLYGDINGDGNMMYVEYTCNTVTGDLSRNIMAWNAASKPALTGAEVLLSGIQANPDGTPCFSYQTTVVGGNTYVMNLAITLTVRTQLVDPITKVFQTEKKALLNITPRNVLNTWRLASMGLANRVQPMPPAILVLLP